jgi:hypothetical protein
VRFRWFGAGVDVCPLDFGLADEIRASACAFAEGGVLRGEGAGVPEPRAESRRWVAAGGLARLQWMLAKPLFLEVDGALRVPLARDAFVFQLPERVVVHAVPAVLGAGAIGFGLRLP